MAAEWISLFELSGVSVMTDAARAVRRDRLSRWIGPATHAGDVVDDAFVNASQVGASERVAEDVDAIRDAVTAWARQGFVHWCDLELADNWFRRAMQLTDDARTAEVDALPYFEQNRRVREAIAALLNGYRALDLPCVIDPGLRGVVERDTDGQAVNPCDSKRWGAWAREHGAYLVGGGACVIVRERVIFRADSTYDERMTFASECEPDGTPSDANWSRHYGLRNGRWCWDSWAFADTCLHRGGFLQAGECEDAVSHFLPPLRFYWDWVREISRSCVRRGPARVLVEALRYALMRNARESLRLRDRMTANERRDTAGQFAALERIAREDLAKAQDNQSRVEEFFAGGGAGGVVVGAQALVAGPVGAIMGAVLYGIARAVFGWLPAAVAHNLDVFGRDQPVFERNVITADVTKAPTADEPRRGAPTHDVPEPPGFVRTGNTPEGFDLSLHLIGGAGGIGARGTMDLRFGGDRIAAAAMPLRTIEQWRARGVITVIPAELRGASGGEVRPRAFGLPSPRESVPLDSGAVATGAGALVLALLAALVSRVEKKVS